uniref:RING-type E3 ubiquitin transferase (cysteine targeting) n=1 Tax=Arcella intermedia TaxID=1963864 RepID=A0A6B2LCZ0_9EUKA
MRVSQLDGFILDQELQEMLKHQFNRIFSLFPEVSASYNPEVSLALELILFYIAIVKRNTTYGYSLQGLKFQLPQNPTTKMLTLGGYALLNILFPYLLSRIATKSRSWMNAPQPHGQLSKVWWVLNKAENWWKVLALVNFIVFLYDGKYPTLGNRILQLRLVHQSTQPRSVSFEFMNRQLLWNGFTDFMFFLMPLINLNRLKEFANRLIGRIMRRENSMALEDQCAICDQKYPLQPYVDAEGKCHHLFCYVCIKEKLMEQGYYDCREDGVKIRSVTREVQ